MKTKTPFISIVCPCYNEEKVIDHFLKKITEILKNSNKTYEIIFIDDGSTDNTLNVLMEYQDIYEHIRILQLSRNFGKEIALTAGIDATLGETVVPIDVDLQDPPEIILDFMKKYEEGYHVVLGKRVDRTSDSFSKKFFAESFYKLHNKISR